MWHARKYISLTKSAKQQRETSESKWTLNNKTLIHHIYFNGSRTNPFAALFVYKIKCEQEAKIPM